MKTYIITAGSYDDYRIHSILDGPVDMDITGLFIEYCTHYGLDLPRWLSNPRFEQTGITSWAKEQRRKREAVDRLIQDNLIEAYHSDHQLYFEAFETWLIRDKGFTESTAEEAFLGE